MTKISRVLICRALPNGSTSIGNITKNFDRGDILRIFFYKEKSVNRLITFVKIGVAFNHIIIKMTRNG